MSVAVVLAAQLVPAAPAAAGSWQREPAAVIALPPHLALHPLPAPTFFSDHHVGSGDPLALGEGAVVGAAGGVRSRTASSTSTGVTVVPIGVPSASSVAHAAFGAVWVLTQGNTSTLQRIDPATNTVTGVVDLGYGESGGNDLYAGGVADADGSLWVSEYFYNQVLRVDPRRLAVVGRVDVGRSPTDVLGVGDSLFVADSHAAAVTRIDARTGRVVATIAVGDRTNFDGGPVHLTYSGGLVWADVPAQRRLYAIRLRDGRVVARPSVAPALACSLLDPAPGAVIIDDSECSNTYSRYDIAAGTTTTVRLPDTSCLFGVAVLRRAVYTVEVQSPGPFQCNDTGSLVRRDITSGAELHRASISPPGFLLYSAGGSLWTQNSDVDDQILHLTMGTTS